MVVNKIEIRPLGLDSIEFDRRRQGHHHLRADPPRHLHLPRPGTEGDEHARDVRGEVGARLLRRSHRFLLPPPHRNRPAAGRSGAMRWKAVDDPAGVELQLGAPAVAVGLDPGRRRSGRAGRPHTLAGIGVEEAQRSVLAAMQRDDVSRAPVTPGRVTVRKTRTVPPGGSSSSRSACSLRGGRRRRNLVSIARRMQESGKPVPRLPFGPELGQHRLERVVIVRRAQPLELAERPVEHELRVLRVDVAFPLLELGRGRPGIQARRGEVERGPFHGDPDAVADAVLLIEVLLGDPEPFLVEGLDGQHPGRSPLLEFPDLPAVVAQAGEDAPRRVLRAAAGGRLQRAAEIDSSSACRRGQRSKHSQRDQIVDHRGAIVGSSSFHWPCSLATCRAFFPCAAGRASRASWRRS